MGISKGCSEEQRQNILQSSTLIKKLMGEGKTYKEAQKMIGCSTNMMSDALKWQPGQERLKKMGNYHSNELKKSQKGLSP